MSAIVLHAGMPKAGSTSIQRWLAQNAAGLREQGFTVVVARPDPSEGITFRPYVEGAVNAAWVVGTALRMPAERRRERADAFVAGLAAAAERYGSIVVSAEALFIPFAGLDASTLAGLQRLSTSFELRVAYYARPQHTSLEAFWRQEGYRRGVRPSVYIDQTAARLHYASTKKGVNELAPGVEFEPRPFRRDQLHRGDVVSDFARVFLDMDIPGTGEWANRGLPLEVANLLHAAPAGDFWEPSYGNQRVKRVKQLLGDLALPEEKRISLSRGVLRRYAFERFAEENDRIGWRDFVPPPRGADDVPGLEALDSLWRPRASPAELAVLFRALSSAIEQR